MGPNVLHRRTFQALIRWLIFVLLLIQVACRNDEPQAGLVISELEAFSTGSPGLMTALSSNETGVSFVNELSLANQIKYTYNGAGVATGDVTGDGLPEIFLANEEGQSKLYRNLGGLLFEDMTEEAGLASVKDPAGFTVGAYFADVDSDGDLDLFITNWKTSNRLFLNDGDGEFEDVTAAAGVGYAGGATTATFADYDRDGDLDFFVATYRPVAIEFEASSLNLQVVNGEIIIPDTLQDRLVVLESEGGTATLRELGEPDLLYRNNGDGTFTEVAAAAGITGGFYGLSAVFNDVDNDGWPDLYVTNDLWSPDAFYHNNGDGTFSLVDPDMLGHTPWFSMGVDFADINNDGFQDYFIGDMLSSDHTKRLTQHGAMDMSPPPPGTAHQVMRNGLYVNNGDGSFTDIAWLADVAATDWTWSVKFADMDLDGFVDLLITNGMVYDLMDSDLAAQTAALQGDREAALALIEQYPVLDNPNLVYRNNGDLTFTDVSDAWGFNTAAVGNGASFADLDGDGDLDVVVNYLNTPAGIYRNDAANNRVMVDLIGQVSNQNGLGARITITTAQGQQTKLMTSSGGYLSSHQPRVTFGLGTLDAVQQLVVEWPSGLVQTFPDDSVTSLPANSLYTITEPDEDPMLGPATKLTAVNPLFADVAASRGLNFAHQEDATFNDFGLQALLPRRYSTLGGGLAFQDIDGDGDDDLYIAGGFGQAGQLYRNDSGTFVAVALPMDQMQTEEMAPLWWYDGQNAQPNLLIANSTVEWGNSPQLNRIRGPNAASAEGVLFNNSVSMGALAAADYDMDGDVDLFVGGRLQPGRWPEAVSSALLSNEGGEFVDRTAAVAAGLQQLGMATGATWSDIDQDGDPDLLVASEFGPVHLFRNDAGQLVEATDAAGLEAWSGLWTGLATGDIDNDGDIDMVAANIGLNTPYEASAAFPLTTFAGDVDGNGTFDLIEAVWVDGVLRPVKERGMAGAAMPFILDQFATFQAFAEASLTEIYGDRLNQAERYEATTLAHTLFINDGNGVFTAQPLPSLAQIQTSYGINLADLDNDGNLDIVMVGNFRGGDMEYGVFDGATGYWLRSNGAGSFSVVESATSGLLVSGEGRGVAIADVNLDGRLDIAVSISDGAPHLFENRLTEFGNHLQLRLVGPIGNPTAVGARIIVTYDGGLAIREQQAGSGYLSQNSNFIHVGIGAAQRATIEVHWPNGEVSVVEADAGARLELQQP